MTENKNKPLTPYQDFFYHHRPRLTAIAALIVIVFAQPTLTSLCIGSIIVILG